MLPILTFFGNGCVDTVNYIDTVTISYIKVLLYYVHSHPTSHDFLRKKIAALNIFISNGICELKCTLAISCVNAVLKHQYRFYFTALFFMGAWVGKILMRDKGGMDGYGQRPFFTSLCRGHLPYVRMGACSRDSSAHNSWFGFFSVMGRPIRLPWLPKATHSHKAVSTSGDFPSRERKGGRRKKRSSSIGGKKGRPTYAFSTLLRHPPPSPPPPGQTSPLRQSYNLK